MKRNIHTSKEGKELLARIRKARPFLMASMTVTKKRCGNPGCRCAKEGPIHETALLTWKEDNKTRTLYVPRELRAEVTQWIEEWKCLRELIREMSQAQREFFKSLKTNRKNSSESS